MAILVTIPRPVAELPAGMCGFVDETEFWGRGVGYGVNGQAVVRPDRSEYCGMVERRSDGTYLVDGEPLEVCDHVATRAY